MSFSFDLPTEDKRRLAFLRVRDAAYDAISALWRARKAQGLSQKDICDALDRDPAWVSRNLAGPANWTMKTFGEFVEALDGHATITVEPAESVSLPHYDIYEDDEDDVSVMLEMMEVRLAHPNGGVVVSLQAPTDQPETIVVRKALAYAG
ncbi:transcriptional regulator [Mesorhizobium loti]|nr:MULTISPECIES: transcriptional regulator [Mesorhizobium]ETA72361.1 hypothetical protein MesloDRAFT_1231 [Mesorhizobium japonicum R7A]MBE1709691.1 transcriptional regulator [Mesorhizobium japonicum]MBE1714360.1 transcriptional regulator [Mesorhizobium japonicum]MUT25340.1 transcriptional regulator [Mesorhizobium japonicum]MUT28606.1 transcriptional regulator [Mesorhizobium japonicum]